jgi:type 1 glutamine amidotransferase
MAAASFMLTAFLMSAHPGQLFAAETAATKIAIIVGPSTHPPGTHEVPAGGRLLAHCLNHMTGMKPVRAEVFSTWPGKSALDNVATIVFLGDLFPPERMKNPDQIKADLASLMDRGCGMVCLHFATGLRKQHMSEDEDHPLLRWIGGCFYRGVARVVTATLEPAKVDHPVLRGWKTFTFHDEPYWNNYFGKNGPADNVTPLATSMLPPKNPTKQIVAWAVDRPDGGRGVGIVVPHFYRSWKIDDLRTLVLNSICWTAKLEIPREGVQTSLPDLATFKPDSVEPLPPPKKEATKSK